MKDLWTEEMRLRAGHTGLVCGVDEAGRGPLAGPVFAAAVILPEGLVLEGLDDSKKLTAQKRDALFSEICEKAAAYGIGSASEKEIDEVNILEATFLAMNRAICQLPEMPELILVDGNRDSGLNGNTICVVKGDGKCASIAAASILAKVSRDRFMEKIAEQYPEYGFERHKGYPTKAHYDAIRQYGVLDIHRRSFLKRMH